MQLLNFAGVIKRWPLLDSLLERFLLEHLKEKKRQHLLFLSERVDKRMQRKTDRPDSKPLDFRNELGSLN